jgi:hypothetical protein
MAGMVEDRREYAAGLHAQAELAGELRKWNRLLQEIDPHLQLIKAPENSHHPSLRSGYYHIIRTPPDGIPMIRVHEGDDGEFREPDSKMLEDLRAGDMWNDRAMREKSDRDRKLQAAAERRRAQEQQDRVEELMDRVKAAWNPGTLITKDLK